jgi:hypothetical protein
MLKIARWRTLCVVVSSALCSGCPADVWLYVVGNGSTKPITVTFAGAGFLSASGELISCSESRVPKPDQAGKGVLPTAKDWKSQPWVAIPATQDLDRCSFTVVLEPGTSVVVEQWGPCATTEEKASTESGKPAVSYLRVEGSRSKVEVKGWQAARIFAGRGDHLCAYVYS